MKKNLILVVALIAIGLIARIVPHAYNFTPMTAIALLSAYAFKNKWIAIGIPLLSFWISDLIINNFVYAGYYENFKIFSPSFLWVYGSILCISIMGRFAIKNVNPKTIGLSSVAGSSIFFILTNFGVWATSTMYAKSFIGLIQCYTFAIPFFGGTLLGDLVYSTVLFSSYSLVVSKSTLLHKAQNIS